MNWCWVRCNRSVAMQECTILSQRTWKVGIFIEIIIEAVNEITMHQHDHSFLRPKRSLIKANDLECLKAGGITSRSLSLQVRQPLLSTVGRKRRLYSVSVAELCRLICVPFTIFCSFLLWLWNYKYYLFLKSSVQLIILPALFKQTTQDHLKCSIVTYWQSVYLSQT